MERLYVSEMNREQLEKVFKANEKVRQTMADWAYDADMDYVQEHLNCFSVGAIDYCVGYDRGCFIQCLDPHLFMDGVIKMQKNLGYPTTEDIEWGIRMIDVLQTLMMIPYDSANLELAYDFCDDEFENIAQRIADKMNDDFISWFESALFEDERHCEMFLDAGYTAFEDCYIDADADDYILYKDVTETFN